MLGSALALTSTKRRKRRPTMPLHADPQESAVPCIIVSSEGFERILAMLILWRSIPCLSKEWTNLECTWSPTASVLPWNTLSSLTYGFFEATLLQVKKAMLGCCRSARVFSTASESFNCVVSFCFLCFGLVCVCVCVLLCFLCVLAWSAFLCALFCFAWCGLVRVCLRVICFVIFCFLCFALVGFGLVCVCVCVFCCVFFVFWLGRLFYVRCFVLFGAGWSVCVCVSFVLLFFVFFALLWLVSVWCVCVCVCVFCCVFFVFWLGRLFYVRCFVLFGAGWSVCVCVSFVLLFFVFFALLWLVSVWCVCVCVLLCFLCVLAWSAFLCALFCFVWCGLVRVCLRVICFVVFCFLCFALVGFGLVRGGKVLR